MKTPIISLRQEVHHTECCHSCHSTENLKELRIGNTVVTLCRSCLDVLNAITKTSKLDDCVLQQARQAEAHYKRLYEDLLWERAQDDWDASHKSKKEGKAEKSC